MKKITVLLYIFLSIFTSCEEEVDYYDLGVKNLIVVNGRFVDGETPWCQVSRSDIVFDQIKNKITPTTFLPDAKVTANDGNSDFTYVVVGDSAKMEAKGLTPKAGESYTLKASANGLDDVYSTVTIPNKPQASVKLISVEKDKNDWYWDIFENSETGYKATFEINIQDDPNTEDYYQLLIYANTKNYEYEYRVVDTVYTYWAEGHWVEVPQRYMKPYVVDSSMAYEECNFGSDDPVMNWNQSQSNSLFEEVEWNSMNIFNDQLFNGQTSKIRFYIYINKNEIISGPDFSYPVYYELRHINKEMYMYYRTYQKVSENEWTGSLSPYILYCNVENGAGLVAAWSAAKDTLQRPVIPKD